MKIIYGNVEILCDSCIETDGKWTCYQGGVPIRQFANVPDPAMLEAEGGEIEHSPSEQEKLEAVHQLIEDLGDETTAARLRQFLKDLKGVMNET